MITRRATFGLAAATLAAEEAIAQLPQGGPSNAAPPRGGELRIGMTLNDIPTARGAPDQGGEGIRWMGFTIYDSLVYWNLGQEETIPRIVPALAERYAPNPENTSEWIFHLRRGVKFHDGSDFNADAVIFNLEKLLTREAPHYDPQQRLTLAFRLPDVKTWRKIDDFTLAIGTGTPNAYLLDQVVFLHISSPAQWRRLGGWEAFGRQPSGTGPFRVHEIVPRQRAVLLPFAEYWDVARRPKLDRLVLLPIPDANTRVAAILSNQANFIEAPPPDAIPALRAQRMVIKVNPYPHIWPYILRHVGDGTPLADVRVRQALNLAVNREEIVQLLSGLAMPAQGMVLPDSPWFGNPRFRVRYDPAEARRLLAEAGYNAARPLQITFQISTSGSGQMQPLPMNEAIQQQMRAVGIDLRFDVVEWNAMRVQRTRGPLDPTARGLHAINNSMGISTPFDAFQRFFSCAMAPPEGLNWSGVCEPALQSLLDQAVVEFDETKRDALLARAHEIVVDNAYWLWVVHDVNPRALRPEVLGFSQAKSWYQDLTQVTVRR